MGNENLIGDPDVQLKLYASTVTRTAVVYRVQFPVPDIYFGM